MPYGGRIQSSPNPNIPNILGSQTNFYPNQPNRFGAPPMNEEEFKLRKNIELLGGIEKTIPSIFYSFKNCFKKQINRHGEIFER